ncbi:hypothetical protein C8R46DRAFT_1214030 [Mycena filopes]|nr:hypothetical protein C8R46DRAFT_1214030 [Mycena filopes]
MQWEISPQFLEHCLHQVYGYDEKIHVWVQTEAMEKRKEKPKKKKYKHMAKRVHSVAATLLEEFRIVCHFPSDPLENMPPLNPNPPSLVNGERYAIERSKEMNVHPDGFLWEEEENLVHNVIRNHEMVFA